LIVSTSLFAAALATWRAVHDTPADRNAAHDFGGAIVKLSIKTVAGARTAENLGAEREGTGVVIDASGVILTIGYLILESESILVVTGDGRIFPAHVIGFDHATGFGLLRAAPGVAERPLELGDSDAVRELNAVRVAAHSAADGVGNACVVARRRFTGWWEYMLEDAIFTAPPRYDHSGAALIDESGRLVGIASLWVSDALDLGVAFPGNMFVPVDLLKPVYDDLVSTGRRRAPPRPWLGLYSEEVEGHVVVTRVLPGAPADAAGLQRGDVILGVGPHAIGGQAEFYTHLWERDAGEEIMLHILRKRAVQRLLVRTGDRLEYLRPWRI
jgi:S1-C subfamily serine protease